ncbi:MAG: thioredoxin family protein [Methanothrix sp.]|nr:thioredoxin family protein [Methanothrix sp.]
MARSIAWTGIAALIVATAALADPSPSDGSYVPAHALGSGDDDWWTVYPEGHARAGSEVQHPEWVLDGLEEKPLLILVHSSTCRPCLERMASIDEVLESYRQDLEYEDVLGEGDGVQRAMEILSAYDPEGGEGYVPTTIFLTRVRSEDGVKVAWHSVIDAMSRSDIEDYIKDAIYYYRTSADEGS